MCRHQSSPSEHDKFALATETMLQNEQITESTIKRFAQNPAVLVIDFPTFAEQGSMLNRIAAWAEKAGQPHDRLLNDAELAATIKASGRTPDLYYYGHDYSSAEIAQFFRLADRDHLGLDREEQALRQIVTDAAERPAGFGALITLTRADPNNKIDPSFRHAILHHELSHGEYFTNPTYARFVKTIWDNVLTEAERADFRTYLANEGYDPALEDVMRNEMQAYLMHTPDPRFFAPERLGISPARLLQIRQSFIAGMPAGWLKDATAISAP